MDHRVKFGFEVTFRNGGGIQGQDFRLDIPGSDISDEDLVDYIVRDMRLLMVDNVRILGKQIITEQHKRPVASPYIDLSHTVYDGLVTYKGLPAPIICDFLSREASRARYAPGTEFQIGRIDMVANTGTYVDSPFHRYPDGKDLSEVGVEAFTDLDAVVIRADHHRELQVGSDAFNGVDVHDKAVLVHTGWAERWATDAYFETHPFLTADAASYLRDQGARLVGIDALNIDDTRDGERPVHSILLRAGILIAEHLCNLESLPDQGFEFSAVPPKFQGVGTFPVRAYARLRL